MSQYFFDTSALVKRYLVETGSSWVNQIISQPERQIYISRLTETEVSAALTRRLNSTDAPLVLKIFDQDLIVSCVPVTITDIIIDNAVMLARSQRLRGCDSLQLATALEIAKDDPSLIFVCSDNDLLLAAVAQGLQTENPELHP